MKTVGICGTFLEGLYQKNLSEKMKVAKQHTSDETRRRMSEAQKRRNLHLSNNPNAKKVICLDSMKVYGTIKEASEDVGVSFNLISATCHKRQHSAGGYHWMLYSEWKERDGG